MRVFVILHIVLLQCSDILTICDGGGGCSCERTWGKINCSCIPSFTEELVLNQSSMYDGTSAVKIENCSTVRVKAHVWELHRDMRFVEFYNIGELIIESNAFSWNETIALESFPQTGLTINIVNSTIPEIPSFAFKGRLTSITFNGVHIEVIRAFAFASLHNTDKLELIESVINTFEAQAFKKFSLEKLHIIGGQFNGTMPSRVMAELEVKHDFLIDRVKIGTIRSSAFIIHGPKFFRLRNTHIDILEGDAFQVKTRGKTFIQNNVFSFLARGAFLHVGVERYILKLKGLQDFKFENNTIGNFELGSLFFNSSSFEIKLDQIHLNRTCSCSLLSSWIEQLSIYEFESQGKEVKHLKPELDNPFWCQNENNRNTYINFYEFSKECMISSGMYVFLIIIVTSALALLALILLVIFWCHRWHSNNQRRWINVPTSSNNDHKSKKITKANTVQSINQNGQDARLPMVVPDGRTYRETELHVIVERTEPMVEHEIVDTTINERRKTETHF